MLTIKKVEKALSEIGANVHIWKGEGYYYFYGPDADHWFDTMVYVSRLNDLTLDQWIEEYRMKKNANRRE